jgi:hypothetical protein
MSITFVVCLVVFTYILGRCLLFIGDIKFTTPYHTLLVGVKALFAISLLSVVIFLTLKYLLS